jgi:hypothetical protein
MLNKPLLGVKIPYADTAEDMVEKFNYTAKTLNSTFRDIASSSTVDSTIPGVITFVDISFTIADNASATLAHNLGQVPSGWIVIDNVASTPSALGILQRTGWDATNISLTNRGLIAGNVSYEIRVFL